jgi:pimeloyl-ACP methyl ester carboxylesterase
MDILIPILSLIAILSVVAGAFLWMGARARAALKAKYPPPGQLIDIGGYRLHLSCQGESEAGAPTVVLDAGLGEDGSSWALVQPEVARLTRVCVYDRAGLGWSDPSPKPRTNMVMVEELRSLLHAAGLPAPYVLAGASLGGLNVRYYAHKYPDEVAGLVLVDSAHEDQYTSEGMRKAFDSILQMMPRMYGIMRLLVRSGLPALFPGRFAALAPVPARLPEQAARASYALRVRDPNYFQAAEAETSAVLDSHAHLRGQQITSLGDLPLIVLQHGRREVMQTPELTELNEQTNRELQPRLAAQSTRGRLVVAEESGHAIQFEQPELVVECILETVKAARDRMMISQVARG